jgi:hypothetical protein
MQIGLAGARRVGWKGRRELAHEVPNPFVWRRAIAHGQRSVTKWDEYLSSI